MDERQGPRRVAGAVRDVAALVTGRPGGMTAGELTQAAQARYPRLPAARVGRLLAQALEAGLLREDAGRLYPATVDSRTDEPADEPAAGSAPAAGPGARPPGLRGVAVDLESVVRTTAVEPYTERRIFQIGAVRIGTDNTWALGCPSFERFVELPDDSWEIRSDALRARHAEGRAPVEQALAELREFCEGTDLLVAHNGTTADFALLDETCARAEAPPLPGERVDSLYLAHALWPLAGSHRLGALVDTHSLNRSDLTWHDAADDARLLARLLDHAAAEYAAWDEEQRDLVASVCPDSPAWRLLGHLAGRHAGLPPGTPLGAPARVGHGEVAVFLARRMAGHPRRRITGRPRRSPIPVGEELRTNGRVDPTLLAGVLHGGTARPRPPQQQMADALHSWIGSGGPAMVEAPTGTGKSLAVLAAALDWLAGDPSRTAVVATYTKQLQNQLARDLTMLEKAVPGLLDSADVVKGSANRLSLRALTRVLADATAATAVAAAGRPGAGGGRGGRLRFLHRTAFRELAVYLLLRLIAAPGPPESWTARSVDPADLPAPFSAWCGRVLPLWLDALSQSGGDFPASGATQLSAHTDTVREALAARRLVLANHAVLLSHLEDLRALSGDVLLVADEAHLLEDAATSALTTELDYGTVESLLAEFDAWLREARAGEARDRVRAAVEELATLLDLEILPRTAGEAFDALGGTDASAVGSRAVTLTSPYGGTAGRAQVRRLLYQVRRLADVLGGTVRALAGYAQAHARTLDFFALERLHALRALADELEDAARRLITDADEVLAPVVVAGPATSPDRSRVDDAGGDREEESEPAASTGVLLPNRVVHAEELEVPQPGMRRYRFRLASSPVELPADPLWQRFLTAFPRTYYVSATLRVSGQWTFVKERLGLPDRLTTLDLPTPFRLADQAELVCFSDFPSWAEQTEGAMRTAAHQLAGLATQLTARRTDGQGWDGGALVLTTARATAGGITERLTQELRRRGHGAPVLGALTLGNARAFREFADPEDGGGFLVGTKGLWQGVDVSDERRLRLVWINKLPFAPFAAPVVEARRAAVRARAEAAEAEDPDAYATEHYYLPLAALQLRQAVGRLIRSERHRGVVVISDRKLDGHTALRRAYRRAFLGSLDGGLLRPDPVTGETGGGNVVSMHEGWARIWDFYARHGLLPAGKAAELCSPQALREQTLLPQTRQIRELELTPREMDRLRAEGGQEPAAEVLRRCALVGGLLRFADDPSAFRLKDAQRAVISAVAEGRNVLGLLPTGFGKSFTFQLPALVLPGVTLVVSPLVALMQDQALELNRSIGGAVRALIAPLRESSSRAGKTEVAEQLLGVRDHGIKLLYVSPERLCQRRFRELVREAVEAGRISRIALDEAHTVVQWDDFRPSMRRVERLLAELRHEAGLPVTALTATANRTVHAGLRQGVFGLPPDPPAGNSPAAHREATQPGVAGSLVTVRENPIRPELAVFRRSMNRSGPATVAGLVEEVADAVAGHAVFYCLTVKEVVTLHARLREYLGETRVRVRRFHGRLTAAEKGAVLTEFREAPREGEEGFAPLLVVATSAFGLGIDRDDIRTVFCVSAPTDLAALYQQLGRAGRDVAGAGAAAGPRAPANTALSLLTTRGLRTVSFLTGQDLPPPLLTRMGRAVLRCGTVLDAVGLADDLIGQDLAEGRIGEAQARSSRTAESYATGVMRVLAALADTGALSDLGDFPPECAVRPGELPAREPEAQGNGQAVDAVVHQVVASVLDLPARRPAGGGGLHRGRLDVAALDRRLAARVAGYRDLADSPAGTWQLLADLHDRGLLDVSAAPSQHWVTGIEIHRRDLPPGFLDRLSGRRHRAAEEIAVLEDFHTDTSTCAHRKFADYFGVAELPEGCCTTAANRCSACWDSGQWPPGESEPATGRALRTARPRPAAGGLDTAHGQQRLDDQVLRLVWAMRRGVHANDVSRTLRGEDSYYLPGRGGRGRRVPVPRQLVTSRFFGARADVSTRDVQASLERLAARGQVALEGTRWSVRRSTGSGPTAGSAVPAPARRGAQA
ncbi:ATP-dependent DNA helicase RecQ [Streptomyces aidingensis]|uniref:DNA 3'-5' helicase n=1 Tax=Streptomyces aidingensis TaxID=910347 RepID=A0A1I1MC85_9ACTN|nr:ATP-dependent DNA helicase RecQ [Streptomyces aidingensis]